MLCRFAPLCLLVFGVAVRAQSAPYYGSPLAVPGTIQAQWFDHGGEGVAYHDCDAANQGGAFRTDEGVDLASSNEGNYYVGWLCDDEWIAYTLDAGDTAAYIVEVRVASESTGGTFRLDFFDLGGALLARTPAVSVPVTGGWESWYTVTTTVELPAGPLRMHFVNLSASDEYNVTWFRFRRYDPLDVDRDGFVDLGDWDLLTRCLAGPAAILSPTNCPIRDLAYLGVNDDGVADLRDCALMQRADEATALLEPDRWALIWSDEFDTPGAPDPAKWRYEVGYKIRNDEEQYYTPGDNAFLENGNLVIEARREAYPLPWGGQAAYTAASMSPTTSWLYGRIEVRAQVPTGRGMWPAIWMLGDNIHQVGWPACGEIDIMENVGYDPHVVHGSVHTTTFNHTIGTQQTSTLGLPAPWSNFHIYAIEWYPDRIDFFIDRVKYLTFANAGTGDAAWPFHRPEHLKLNIAVGGAWGGVQGIDDSIFPQRFYVDYVRVYQQAAQ